MNVFVDPLLLATESMSREELLEQLKQLLPQFRRLQSELERLQSENDTLRKENERLLREKGKGVRQRPVRKAQPKEPANGQGPARRRQAPTPSSNETVIEVRADETTCPKCGGELDEGTWEDASTIDLPKAPAPEIKRFKVQSKKCRTCGHKVHGKHPDLSPDQHGATAHRLGDRAMATAQTLNYGFGIPQRKIPAILKQAFNLEVTQGALSHDAARRCGHLEFEHEQLREKIRSRPVVHTDDTGWRVGGQRAQLMVFTTPEGETLYQIRLQHRNEEVREVLPEDWPGTMVTDRGRSYDARILQGMKQHKCTYHVLSSIQQVVDIKLGKDRYFGLELKDLSQQGIGLWNARKQGQVNDDEYALQAHVLQGKIDEHLEQRELGDVDNDRLRRELAKHNDRGNLFRFFLDPQIHPTNNLAEREVRAGVIARKVSQCSKTWTGAHRREVLQSIIRTEIRKAPGSIIEVMTEKFRNARIRAEQKPCPPL